MSMLSHLQRVRQCLGKQSHKSKGKAEAHLRALARRSGDENLTAYYCQFCRGYHVGHTRRDHNTKEKANAPDSHVRSGSAQSCSA